MEIDGIANFSSLSIAWQRVLENHGCRGSDGVTIEDFAAHSQACIAELSFDLSSGRYHPYPLLRFPVPKRKKPGSRNLSVPTVRDRVAQTAFFLSTRELFEAQYENVSHAYRQGRGLRSAFAQVKYWYDKGYRYAVDADITAFFDNVPHALLLQKVAPLLADTKLENLVAKWVQAEVYDGQKIWTLDKGIPQGSVISPILANLFLDELDEMLLQFDRKLVRYADDFLVLSKTRAEAEENIELTDMILEDLQLDLNPAKTEIVSFDHGFKFLGSLILKDEVYYPEWQTADDSFQPQLPPPLTLKRYLELKNG